jgi:hypothetical protein
MSESQKSRRASNTRIFLILESTVIFLGSLLIYLFIGGNWIIFIILLFSPDIFIKNSRIGSIIYNIGHIHVWAIILILIGILIDLDILILLGLIWISHISIDRAMGYGLKYPSDFKDTHMQKI